MLLKVRRLDEITNEKRKNPINEPWSITRLRGLGEEMESTRKKWGQRREALVMKEINDWCTVKKK